MASGVAVRKPSGRARRLIRGVFVEAFAALPMGLKQALVQQFNRPLLWLLFCLEPERLTVVRAGPRGCRFTMRLNWQGHTDYVLGIYEPEVEQALRRYVRPGDCCMDVGANIGYSSLLLSRLVSERGKVVAYEPFPENYAALEENVRRNGCRNVLLRLAALGEQAGELTLVYGTQDDFPSTPSARGYAVEGPRARLAVPMDTLDNEVRRLGLAPRLIKIDVEGDELAVLRGATQTLREIRPLVLVEIHGWGSQQSKEVLGLLEGVGYRTERIGQRRQEVFCLALPK